MPERYVNRGTTVLKRVPVVFREENVYGLYRDTLVGLLSATGEKKIETRHANRSVALPSEPRFSIRDQIVRRPARSRGTRCALDS